MELQVLSKSKDSLEFKIIGERHTLPALLKSFLLEDPKVEFASYKLEHPLDADSIFVVKTQGKTPQKALEDAVKAVNKELEQFKSSVKKIR